jgi:hypothetical protein
MSILQTIIHLLFFSVSIYLYYGAYGLLNLNILMWRRNCPLERRKNESPRFFLFCFRRILSFPRCNFGTQNQIWKSNMNAKQREQQNSSFLCTPFYFYLRLTNRNLLFAFMVWLCQTLVFFFTWEDVFSLLHMLVFFILMFWYLFRVIRWMLL